MATSKATEKKEPKTTAKAVKAAPAAKPKAEPKAAPKDEAKPDAAKAKAPRSAKPKAAPKAQAAAPVPVPEPAPLAAAETAAPIAPAPAAPAPVAPTLSPARDEAPEVTIIIPVYNEERILFGAVEQLIEKLASLNTTYEIILAENGSTDQTIPIGEQLSAKHPFVTLYHHPEPDYGLALKAGILRARGRFVICDEIDLCDVRFYESALRLLRSGEAEMVIGSKALAASQDERPLMRRVATKVLNGMLRVGTGFKGTDTHGLKAFARTHLLSVIHECKLGKDLFASEFVIRAERSGHMVTEVPLQVREMRAPSINLYKRVPKVLKDMGRLIYLIRIKG